jgi:hypothetical protein
MGLLGEGVGGGGLILNFPTLRTFQLYELDK